MSTQRMRCSVWFEARCVGNCWNRELENLTTASCYKVGVYFGGIATSSSNEGTFT